MFCSKNWIKILKLNVSEKKYIFQCFLIWKNNFLIKSVICFHKIDLEDMVNFGKYYPLSITCVGLLIIKMLPREILGNLSDVRWKKLGVVSFTKFSNFVRVIIYFKWINSVKIKFGSKCLHCFLYLSIYPVFNFFQEK